MRWLPGRSSPRARSASGAARRGAAAVGGVRRVGRGAVGARSAGWRGRWGCSSPGGAADGSVTGQGAWAPPPDRTSAAGARPATARGAAAGAQPAAGDRPAWERRRLILLLLGTGQDEGAGVGAHGRLRKKVRGRRYEKIKKRES